MGRWGTSGGRGGLGVCSFWEGMFFFRFYLVVFFLCTGDMWSWMRCCVRSPGVYLARLLGSAA